MSKIDTHIAAASGLPPREAQVWEVLSLGRSMNIMEIARATELHRPAIYQVLPQLIQKGLVKENHEQRRTTYIGTGTKAFMHWRAENERVLQTHLRAVRQFDRPEQGLPDDIRVFQGKQQLREIWTALAQMTRGTVFYRYDGYKPGVDVRAYIPQIYFDAIKKKQIDRFVITNAGLRKSAYKKRVECASRMLPGSAGSFEQGICQFVFDDTVAFVDFSQERGYLIKNAAIAEYQRKLFLFLYGSLKE